MVNSLITIIFITICWSCLASSPSPRRALVGFNPATSTVSGTGIVNFEAGTNVNVDVDSGSSISGETIILKISNRCTVLFDTVCFVNTGADTTIAKSQTYAMTDDSDGTYSQAYTVGGEGDLSVMAIHLTEESVNVNQYNNSASGPNIIATNFVGTITWDKIDTNWTSGVLFDGKNDNVSLTAHAYIKSPFQGDVIFTLKSDDGSTLWFDGEEKISNYNQAGPFNNQFTVNLTQNSFYEVYIEFYEDQFDAYLQLSWSYGSQAEIVVPKSAFYAPSYISTSPYNITVSCPEGTSIDPHGDQYTCQVVCGDGMKADSETCDDNNTNSNDGCLLDCSLIEDGWTCTGGSPTSKDSCSQISIDESEGNGSNDHKVPDEIDSDQDKCGNGIITLGEECDDGNNISDDGCSNLCTVEKDFVCQRRDNRTLNCFECDPTYKPNEHKDACIKEDEPDGIFEVSMVYVAVLGIGIIANIILSVVAGQSIISCLSVIYQIQILMLIPMSNYFTGNKVYIFFEYVRVILATYHFIPKYFVFWGWDSTFGKYEHQSSHWYLQTLGFDSTSALSNSGRIIFVFGSALCCFGVISSISILSLFTKEGSRFRRVTKSIFNFVLTRVFITLIFISFVSLFISSTYEISGDNDTQDSTESLISAYSIGGFCVATFITSIAEWIRCMKPERFQNQYFLKGLYHGINDSNYARLYPCVWMLRRMAFVSVFVCISNDGTLIKLSVIWTIQSLYLLYLLCGKTLKSRKDKFIEIMNEIVVLVISVNHQVKLPLFDTTYLTLIYFCNAITCLTALTIITAKIIVKLAASPIPKREIVRVYSMNKVKPVGTSQISGLPSQASHLDLASNYQESARDILRAQKKELKNARRVVDWNK